jgi:hypothetical protein
MESFESILLGGIAIGAIASPITQLIKNVLLHFEVIEDGDGGKVNVFVIAALSFIAFAVEAGGASNIEIENIVELGMATVQILSAWLTSLGVFETAKQAEIVKPE